MTQIAGNPPGPSVVDLMKYSTNDMNSLRQTNKSANISRSLILPSPTIEKKSIKENSADDSFDSEAESTQNSKPKRPRGKRGGKEQRKRDEKKAAKEQAFLALKPVYQQYVAVSHKSFDFEQQEDYFNSSQNRKYVLAHQDDAWASCCNSI